MKRVFDYLCLLVENIVSMFEFFSACSIFSIPLRRRKFSSKSYQPFCFLFSPLPLIFINNLRKSDQTVERKVD